MSRQLLRWLLALGAGARVTRRGASRLTIVRHHRIYPRGARALYHLGVSETILAGQLETCARAGLTPLTVSEGLAWLERGEPGQAVAFSFDDGYADNMTLALPILQRHGAHATCFLAAGLMETRTAPWWDELAFILEHATVPTAEVLFAEQTTRIETHSLQLRRTALAALLPQLRVAPAQMRARLDHLRKALGVSAAAPCELAQWPLASRWVEAGMEVGAHTLTHPFLTTLPPEAQAHEIGASADLIRERLAAPVTGLAYPVGDHDDHTVEAARACGLSYAVTTRAGDTRPDTARFRLPRRALSEGACVGPTGHYSSVMARAELGGAFDRLRGRRQESGT